VAEGGIDEFYRSEIAKRLVRAVRDKGGFLTVDDLVGFEASFVEPMSTTYGGAEIFELPPNNQRLIALEALNIAEDIGATEHPIDSPARVHYFAEALKLAFHDGHYYITDPEYEPIPTLGWKAYAHQRAGEISEMMSASGRLRGTTKTPTRCCSP
jgi:gamma-glutamyltranspeptidase/glutathione hydrolase